MFGDVAKTFGRSFVVAYFVPAVALVFANIFLMVAGFLPKPNAVYWTIFGLPKTAIIFIVVGFIALMLAQFYVQIVRIYEGFYYIWIGIVGFLLCVGWFINLLKPEIVGWISQKYNLSLHNFFAFIFPTGGLLITIFVLQLVLELFHKKRYKKKSDWIEKSREKNINVRDDEVWLTRNYPRGRENVLPTKLGNVIAAFEDHPYTLYNIDPITGWMRLMSVLPQSYQVKIEQAETNFLFVLNLSFIITLLALEALTFLNPIAVMFNGLHLLSFELLVMTVFCFVTAYVLYRSACSYAEEEWGEYVRAAFDLYRLDLLKQTGMFLPARAITLDEEKKIWDLLQIAALYLRDPGNELRFLPKSWETKDIKHSTIKLAEIDFLKLLNREHAALYGKLVVIPMKEKSD